MENQNRNSGPGNNNGNNNQNPKRPSFMAIVMAVLFTLIMFAILWSLMGSGATTKEVKYSEFIEDLENGKIDEIEISGEMISYTLKKADDGKTTGIYSLYLGNPKIIYSAVMIESESIVTQRALEQGVVISGITTSAGDLIMNVLLTVVLPLVLMWILLGFLFRKMGGGGPMGVGKSNAKVYVQKETGVTFEDVAGADEAKESLIEVVDFLHNPGKYSAIGAKQPKGALLVGPPGTGKTLLAKAVAGEAKVPFFSLTGSDFVELYVGVGASRVRDLFKEAAKNAPCIVFIDEIDAIGRSRDSKYGGGNEEREQTLNQLLAEMDGFDGSTGIFILAATNRPEILDKALLRPGRFDRRIIVDKPDLKGRVAILKVHAKGVKLDETVDLEEIALATSGAVGSDLANMINEGAINAVKEKREFFSQKDLFAAVEQVLVGKEKKDRIMSKEERRIVSYHEVGHALVSALQKNSEPVQKITIVPRTMGALGYVMHVPEEEKYLNTEAELRDMLVGLLAGRAAEEIVFDTVTTGASNDIEKATNIAKAMITQYGMSEKFGLIGLATVESRYLDGSARLNCSDVTAAEIDQEVVKLLKESYDKALELLRENRELMDKLAEFLIEKETITGKEFMQIFRKEKGIPEPEEKKDGEKSAAEGAEDADKAEGEGVEAGANSEDEAKPDNNGVASVAEESKDVAAESDRESQASTVDVTVTDETKTTKEQEAKEEATPQVSDAAKMQQEAPAQDENVGRFSNGRL